MDDIFQKDLSGEMVSPDELGYNDLINAIWDTMRLADELNTGHHTPDEVRDFLSRITGREIDPSDSHRGQGLDRHRRHRPARGTDRLRGNCRGQQRRDARCSAHDGCRRQSRTVHQGNKAQGEIIMENTDNILVRNKNLTRRGR